MVVSPPPSKKSTSDTINGVVERKYRQIVDLGLTLLHHATLPLQFWDYTFVTAVYLINRLPTASLNFAIPFVF